MKKLFVLAMVLSLASLTSAATYDWDGSDSTTWGTAANWNSGITPGTGDIARLSVAGATTFPTIVAGQDYTVSALYLGVNSQNNSLTMSGGKLTTLNTTWNASLRTATFGTGTFNISGGTITVGGGVILAYGNNTNTRGVINMSGGVINIAGSTAVNAGLCLGITVPSYILGYGIVNMGMAGIITADDLLMDSANSKITFTAGSQGAAKIVLKYTTGYGGSNWAAFKSRITGSAYANKMTNEKFVIDDTGQVITIIPEPATIAMLGLGGLALLRRKH